MIYRTMDYGSGLNFDLAYEANQTGPIVNSTIDPMVAERLQYIQSAYGNIPPEQALALAKSYASNEAIAEASRLTGVDQAQPEQGTAVERGIGRVLKYVVDGLGWTKHTAASAIGAIPGVGEPIMDGLSNVGDAVYNIGQSMKTPTRWMVAGLDAIPETIANVGAMLFVTEARQRARFGGFWDSLSIATMIDHPELQGSGFVYSQEIRNEQARRARDFRGQIGGSAWTVGRGISNLFFTPNSEAYRTLSGLIDAIVMVKGPDPTKLLEKGAKAVSALGEVPLLTSADNAIYRAALEADSGLLRGGATMTLDAQKFDNFLERNNRARKLIDELVAQEDPLYIMEKIFKYEIDPDTGMRLARATNRTEVKQALADLWTINENAIAPNVNRYRTLGRSISRPFEETPLGNLRKSRLFVEMPGSSVIIDGDRVDRVNAVKNVVNSLRTAGATEEEIAPIARRVIEAFTQDASRTNKKAVLQAYQDTLRVLLNKNGVADDIAEEIVQGPFNPRVKEKIRTWMIDRAGKESDYGWWKAFYDQFADELPDDFWNRFIRRFPHEEDVAFLGPNTLTQLVNNTFYLPDARKLRRVTRNPFFREMIEKLPEDIRPRKGIGGFTTSKSRKAAFTTIKDEEQYALISEELSRLKDQARLAPGSVTPEEIKGLEDELENLTVTMERRSVTGELKWPLEVIEFWQNQIWKPFTLMSFGYVMRNSIDAQIRMHFGAQTGVFHPLQYMQLVMNRKYRRSIMGTDITATSIEELRRAHREFLTGSMKKVGLHESDVGSHMRLTGQYVSLDYGTNVEKWRQGVMSNLRQIHEDPILKMYAQMRLQGFSESMAVDAIWDAMVLNKQLYNDFFDMKSMGGELYDGRVRIVHPPLEFKSMSGADQKLWLEQYVNTTAKGYVLDQTGDIDEVLFMAVHNRVPRYAERLEVRSADLTVIDEKSFNLEVGTLVRMDDGTEGIVMALKRDPEALSDASKIADVVPVYNGPAFDGFYGSKDAQALVRRQHVFDPKIDPPDMKGLPPTVRAEIVSGPGRSYEWLPNTHKAWDKTVDWFFRQMYEGKWVKNLERSPVYRQFYYEAVNKVLDRVSQESAVYMLSSLQTRAAREGTTIEKFLGLGKKDNFVKRLEAAAAKRSGTGGATMTEIDDYARLIAVNKAKDMLYDASARNNLTDILRVVSPFAGAWAEIIGHYLSMAPSSPHMFRSFQRVYTGAREADPDGDGRGFFYDDPQTGELMFNFPLSGTMIPLIQKIMPGGGTPVQGFLEAPVKQMSQGIASFPSLGPVAQFGASQLFKALPPGNIKDEAIKLLLPYGEKDVAATFNPTPGWLRKVASAALADTQNTDGIYYNTFMETWRAKSASGHYDMSNQEDVDRLYEDSKNDARWLTLLRAASQFIGPASGRTEFKVPTKQGDAIVSEAIKFLQDLQKEDYDTAVPIFLDVLGKDMALYVGSKTRSTLSGLEGSEEFGKWQNKNEDLLQGKYRDVAAYFGPEGSELNFSVWTRQLNKGLREKLTWQELLETAQDRIGSAMYARARNIFGSNRTDKQSQILRAYRESLHQQYPGFRKNVEFTVGQLPNRIAMLQEMVVDPRFKDNPLTQPLRDYLSLRNQFESASGGKGLGGKKRRNIRVQLFEYGNALAAQSPEFDRIWQRLLIQEVDNI